MRIATYNANSIRSRIETVTRWLARYQPDILALQETKVQDSEFPILELARTGYKMVFRGQMKNNGVAILSRQAPENVLMRLPGDLRDEARFIQASFGPVTLINTYIPQGFEIGTDRFQYKLDWFGWLGDHLRQTLNPADPIIWTGDLNAALTDIDVHDPKRLWGTVCYCEPVRQAMLEIMGWGFTDLFRAFHPDERLYTFWDYRVPNSLQRNRGWRLDYILATAPLVPACTDCFVDPEPRAWEKPSDHTFVVADFDLEKLQSCTLI